MENSPLEFARPYWLYAGMALCVLAAWLMFYADRRREVLLARLVHPRFRARLLPGFSAGLQRWKRGLFLAAVLLLCTAAAGPRKGFEWREVKQRGIDILFAVDTSRSMLAEDLAPNRLERARMGVHDFISRLHGDRVGLIPFAGSAFALCPLTADYEAFRLSLDALDTDLIPRQGTDVASAIREAERLFTEQGNNHRILVLITDGEDLQGDALAAAEEAKKNGMTIHPIGVGSAEGAQIPMQMANGRRDLVRDEAGNPVRTKLDEASLQKIASATGGLYAALGRGAEGLDLIYREKLRLVPKEERESRMEKIPFERFEWPLGVALLLLLVEFLLPDRRREARAKALPSAARRHALPAASALVAVLMWLSPDSAAAAQDARALYNEGTAAYDAGEFDKAATALRSSLNTPDLALQNRAYYNLGNTHYRSGQAKEKPDEKIKSWEDAVKSYSDALALDPADADARFNHDLVQRKLDELKKQENKDDQKKDDQKKDGEKKDDEKKDEKEQEKSQEQKGGDQQQKDQQKDGQESKEQQKDGSEGEEKKDGKPTGKSEPKEGDKEGEKKEQPQPGEEQKDGEKQDGKQQAGEAGEKKDEPASDEKGTSEERRVGDQMTQAEARQLLQTLRRDERTVVPIDRPDPRRQRFRDPANSTKGKTW